MSSSILDDVKHTLGLLPANTAFDIDVMMHINSAFGTLHQIGVGPNTPFSIVDNTAVWSDFITDPRLNSAKSYIFLRVKLLFDPPQIGYVISAMERQITELEYRLNTVVDYEDLPMEGTVIDSGHI